jgi:precorrin-2 dehydrogenase/sirohydrochlorin ferrochelatase
MHQVNMLIVGGGNVGLENFRFAKSSPNANVEVVAPRFYLN